MLENTTIIVLAGGKGTRMNQEKPKVLIEVGGRAMVDYVLESIRKLNLAYKPVVVVGFEKELVMSHIGDGVEYVEQVEQRGTGHAVACCREALAARGGKVLVFYGDMPLVGTKVMLQLIEAYEAEGATLVLATIAVENFEDTRIGFYQYGRIIRDESGNLKSIVELKNASEEEKLIREVNPGFYCFNAGWLWENVGKISDQNAQGEFLLTDLLWLAVEQGVRVATVRVDEMAGLGVNTVEQLEVVEGVLGEKNV